ncbi:MAG: type IV pilus assembly protein PilM [Verrucomicrobiia bacterium]
MLNSNSFLSLDFGAGTLKAAEFELNEAGTLMLKRYGVRSLGLEGSQESARETVLRKAINELFTERGFGARRANVCAPGFHVFSKFVKLPPVDTSKVTQIIQYEAQQNVPFPLEEVVWDYQILGTTPSGELEVLLVAIKSDVVEGLFRTAEATGLRLQLVDVSAAALCNAFRFNYGDLEGCTMLLDIGAKTSNLLFFEKGKVYSRGINIGANSITQEFAAEAKLRFAEAEKVKIAEGFVSLGGAYEEPENPHQAAISKIARQVMTRLHIQVNQTIQFYRGQQGGSAPQRLFLAGGASIMPYTSQFFAEKLNIPVDYFNPFRNVQIDPSIDIEDLAKVAHSFGEIVGLGLRNVAQCPVELNLVPKSILKRQQFDQKKPYFIAAVFSLILVVFAYGWFLERVAQVKASSLEEIKRQLEPLETKERELQRHESQVKDVKQQADALIQQVHWRLFWPDVLAELQRILASTERAVEEARPGYKVGVWIETFGTPPLQTFEPGGGETSSSEETTTSVYRMDPRLLARYGLRMRMPSMDDTSTTTKNTNVLENLKVKFRAVNLNNAADSSANGKLAFVVENAIQSSPFFVKDGTKLDGQLDQVGEGEHTFTFGMVLKLRYPGIDLTAKAPARAAADPMDPFADPNAANPNAAADPNADPAAAPAEPAATE